MRGTTLLFVVVLFSFGALWGHYGPIRVVLPGEVYCWTDGYGGEGCGMCPWHDDPEETRELEDKQKNDDGRCGAEGVPDSDQGNARIYGR